MSVSPNNLFYANPNYVDGSNSIINYANLTNYTIIQSNTNSESNITTPDLEVTWDGNILSNVVDGQTLGWNWPINGTNAALAGINLPMIGTTTWSTSSTVNITATINVRTKVWMVHGHHTWDGSRQTAHYVDTTGWTEVGEFDIISPAWTTTASNYDPATYEWGNDLIAWKIYEPGTYNEEFDDYSAHYFFEAAPEPEPEPSVSNVDLSENILSKYARGFFFSPNYNKQFFDAINWANNLGDYKTQLNLINPFNNNVLENLQFDSTIIFTGGIFENGFDKNYTSNVDDIFNPFDLNNSIITANDNPTSGPNAGTQVPISLNTDNIEFRNAIAGNTIIPINNVLNIEPSFDKYFSVIPTGLAYPHDWAFYSFYLIQDGVTIVEFNPTQQNSVTFDDSVNLHNGTWGWQYAPSIYHNRTTPVFYVELPSNYVFSNSTITATLVNYNHTHTPASGNFVSASSPNGPWHIRGNWSVSLPLPYAAPNYSGGTGVPVSSILDNGWQQLGSDIISWKTPGTYYMRYKATDYDGVETPNNDEHYLTITVNQGPIIYQSWKISDVTSNSITIPTNGPWMPQKDVYVKVTPVNAGNKFRLRFQGSTSGRYQLKDIRIAKMYIPGTQPHTLSPWYTISINGTSGQTFFEFPQSDHQWTDWIDAPIEANTPYLVYFKYHHSRDWYTYWSTSTTNSWVNGIGENRVYNIDLMEVEN